MDVRESYSKNEIDVDDGDDLTKILGRACDIVEREPAILISDHRKIQVTKEILLSLFDDLLTDEGEYQIVELSPGDDVDFIPEGSTTSDEKEEVTILDRSLLSLKQLLGALGRKNNVQVTMHGQKFRVDQFMFAQKLRKYVTF